ncbi:uncharacterized protein LOC127566095 [Drosophila albomicans]|uniref:Uncharacterized protein LOC127566095 n=1 Tax=Drosophila albomicans TaxID=7291 RepID=A0A9C6TCQ7_DROAB|nr:uncharacterized protein LOC127566095 [Drosophila albomicans]
MNVPLCTAGCSEAPEEPVWALDIYCKVFRNKCYFHAANCFRSMVFVKPMKIIPKEECQKYCKADCEDELEFPFVVYYKNEVKHFNSLCESELHTCRTGEIFSYSWEDTLKI